MSLCCLGMLSKHTRTCALIHVGIRNQGSPNTLVNRLQTNFTDRRSSREGLLLHDVHSVQCVYHKLVRRQHGPDRGTRAVAILIWFLSRNPDLAVLYLQTRFVALIESTDFSKDAKVAALTMLDWFQDGHSRRRFGGHHFFGASVPISS